MSEQKAKSQLAEVQESIKDVHQKAYQEYPVNSAFPVGCEERAEFIERGLRDVKKRFPKSFW